MGDAINPVLVGNAHPTINITADREKYFVFWWDVHSTINSTTDHEQYFVFWWDAHSTINSTADHEQYFVGWAMPNNHLKLSSLSMYGKI